MKKKICNGPYTCPYPPGSEYRWNDRWRCPSCGTLYRRTILLRHRWEVVHWPWTWL